MKDRQFHQLAGQPKAEYYDSLATGLGMVADHCRQLAGASAVLADAEQWRGAQLLTVLADEEAGKYLVLLDAVRLGHRDKGRLSAQLKRAGDHLAKGLYAQVASIRPADFAEVLAYLDGERKALYLDGPNDVDWIFSNAIRSGRDETLYVDLVETDAGLDWRSPAIYDRLGFNATPWAADLVTALEVMGIGSASALQVIEHVWAGFVPEPATRWREVETRIAETVERLSAAGLCGENFTGDHYRTILDSWGYPLHSTDLTLIPVDPADLRRRQEAALERMYDDFM